MKTNQHKPPSVKAAFEEVLADIAIAAITPLRLVTDGMKRSVKYKKIAASIREAGLVEPPVVARDKSQKGKYLLLDGHLRIECLKDLGRTSVPCLIATDDEAFTYNKYVNRVATVQEHRMIVRAIDSGVPAERLARVLNVNIAYIRAQQNLLAGICPEATELLKDKHVAINAFRILKKMAPLRQIEAAELMIAMDNYSESYAKSLLMATPEDQRAKGKTFKKINVLAQSERALAERETENLEREFKAAEESYSADYLDLVLAKGYLAHMLANPRVLRYLERNRAECLLELTKIG